ncbi:hypothetical protein OMAG_002492 [Candidatus Omnitrophus magneticus]|uniref:Uncharacterized protein n=1 Tax=Candidatus Omnitrophus magneticus TaxID=1609969 RepID=A0A0F0CJX9_9BACT|nr:hypothetical protein OMAG_002492 [Candidatus Omnitrophus magneticus]
MAGPRYRYRERPKKTGIRKRARVKSQKKRLIAHGYDGTMLDKLTEKDLRTLHAKIAGKKLPQAVKTA